MEFQQIREQFLTAIKARNNLYEIRAMEDYAAADRDVLKTCIEDVNRCNIYVLILGDAYGSIAKENGVPSGKSFTYWEYETANQKKAREPDFERLILLKAGAAKPDENPLLTAWKKEIGQSQTQTKWYTSQDEIPGKILESLDHFTLERVKRSIVKKDIIRYKIYLCNRQEIDQEFSISIDEKPMQFFILYGHENDLPHYYIKRKELESQDRSQKWVNIKIKPDIPATVTVFEKAEIYIKSAIFNALKWKKFKTPHDVSPDGILDYMQDQQADYLSISWFIESVLWKNDTLSGFINSFYEKYDAGKTSMPTDKKILFFGILRYVPNEKISETEFHARVQKIRWKHNLSFKKINKQDVKDWLNDSGIEEFETREEDLISLYLNSINQQDLYYKEVEPGLHKIVDIYSQQKNQSTDV